MKVTIFDIHIKDLQKWHLKEKDVTESYYFGMQIKFLQMEHLK